MFGLLPKRYLYVVEGEDGELLDACYVYDYNTKKAEKVFLRMMKARKKEGTVRLVLSNIKRRDKKKHLMRYTMAYRPATLKKEYEHLTTVVEANTDEEARSIYDTKLYCMEGLSVRNRNVLRILKKELNI